MARVTSPWQQIIAPAHVDGADRDPRTDSSELVLLLAAALLPLDNFTVLGRFPASTIGALAIVGWSFWRPPAKAVRGVHRGLLALVALVPVWMTVTAGLNDRWVMTRIGTTLAWAGLVVVLATGRAHAPSVARGALLGLAFGTLTALVGIGPRGYGDRLTGWLADPNGAAMTALTLGISAAVWASVRRPVRWSAVLLVAVTVIATQSRTGLFALSLVLVWVLLLRRVNVLGAAAVAWIGTEAFRRVPESVLYWGWFSERTGSDALREQISQAQEASVTVRPVVGTGPGTAIVEIDRQPFFFHSSYLSARAEGGWVLLLLILAVVLAVSIALWRCERSTQTGWLQGSVIAVLVMSTTIGEALLTPSAALMLGLSLRWFATHPRAPDPPPPTRLPSNPPGSRLARPGGRGV